MTSFSIQSFGCRVNQAEAFDWANTLQSHGLVYRSDSFCTDLVLVNTCTLTSRADRDVRHFMNKMARINPQARLVVTGCYSERFLEDLQKSPQVWQVFRNEEKAELPDRILASLGSRIKADVKPFRSRALIKIQDGCDFRCSFCIIPEVRGQSVSLPQDKIMVKVRESVRQGYKEIVLTGIHICSYGRDRSNGDSLLDLLQSMEKIEGLGQVRLSSLDPRFLDRELRDTITHSPIVCPHFHLSLQHGSDDVIRRMGRKSSAADYRRILDDLHRKKPKAALGADLIVGFPGETERDFEKMFDFLEETPLTYMHVFSYSPRPGTPASRWEQVDERAKKERATPLRELSKRKNWNFRKKLVGDVWDGVVIKQKEGDAFILTSNFVKVHASSCSAKVRDRVPVKIVHAKEDTTQGQIVV
jgi:threonylcarbamoyladenosine tRNA methylthiotransferase MtaB